MDMSSQTFPLTVIARANAELGAGVIYSNQIRVTLDGTFRTHNNCYDSLNRDG